VSGRLTQGEKTHAHLSPADPWQNLDVIIEPILSNTSDIKVLKITAVTVIGPP
jgi:hypothetical protein